MSQHLVRLFPFLSFSTLPWMHCRTLPRRSPPKLRYYSIPLLNSMSNGANLWTLFVLECTDSSRSPSRDRLVCQRQDHQQHQVGSFALLSHFRGGRHHRKGAGFEDFSKFDWLRRKVWCTLRSIRVLGFGLLQLAQFGLEVRVVLRDALHRVQLVQSQNYQLEHQRRPESLQLNGYQQRYCSFANHDRWWNELQVHGRSSLPRHATCALNTTIQISCSIGGGTTPTLNCYVNVSSA